MIFLINEKNFRRLNRRKAKTIKRRRSARQRASNRRRTAAATTPTRATLERRNFDRIVAALYAHKTRQRTRRNKPIVGRLVHRCLQAA